MTPSLRDPFTPWMTYHTLMMSCEFIAVNLYNNDSLFKRPFSRIPGLYIQLPTQHLYLDGRWHNKHNTPNWALSPGPHSHPKSSSQNHLTSASGNVIRPPAQIKNLEIIFVFFLYNSTSDFSMILLALSTFKMYPESHSLSPPPLLLLWTGSTISHLDYCPWCPSVYSQPKSNLHGMYVRSNHSTSQNSPMAFHMPENKI